MIISWKRCDSVTKRHSTSAVQQIVAVSEYGDLKTHMPMWNINVPLLKSMCFCTLQSKNVRSIYLCWKNSYWHDISRHVTTVANATVAKHNDVHIPARWKSRPLQLWSSSVPEHSVTRTLDRACIWNWPTTVAKPFSVFLWLWTIPLRQALWFSCYKY